ncbi:MAG: hypothetical protein AAFY22_00930 [Pseudomonadota bacterium]
MAEVMVIVGLKPKAGKGEALTGLVAKHLRVLREQDLVGDTPQLVGRAKDGTVVEVFRWKSQAAIDAAHENPAVQALWGEFAEVCDYVPIGDVAEAGDLFSAFEPIEV